VKTELENVTCNNCGKDSSRKLFIKNHFRIVQCLNCGLVYTNPRVKRDFANSIYDSTYFKSRDSVTSGYENYLKERPTIEATFRRRINFIFRHAHSFEKSENPRILDIGCAMGFLLNLFRELGWQTEGVELSDFASSYARDELNLSVRQGTLNTLSFPNDNYDLLTSWDVIEHSYNPKEDIKMMHKLTKKGGYVALITPNRASLHARLVGQKWVEYEKPEEHLYFFEKNILIKILRDVGFETVATTTSGKYVSLGFALNRLKSYSAVFRGLAKFLGGNLSGRYVYINPFDKMFLLARKK
jgi:2-polyprenyl-3-methyl-5-hydroxy-6-metoxy-1,4-benzoquinol methylase